MVKVAGKMAAVETLRRGHERYIIMGGDAANSAQVVTTGPTHARTSGSMTGYGNTACGSSTTNFGGRQTMIPGGFDQDLNLVMFKRGEPGFEDAVDARGAPGPDWKPLAEKGIITCS